MKRTHLYILNAAGFLLALLIVTNLWLVLTSQSLSIELMQTQAAIANSRRAEQLLTQLSMRVARDGERDPALKGLLQKHQLKVTFDADARKKAPP
jgi:hypothetical protein